MFSNQNLLVSPSLFPTESYILGFLYGVGPVRLLAKCNSRPVKGGTIKAVTQTVVWEVRVSAVNQKGTVRTCSLGQLGSWRGFPIFATMEGPL